jgi:hypothetical protein
MPINDLIIRKSQELCFALLRVAAHIRRYEMRKTLERLTYHLLENVSYQNAEMSLGTISAIRNFVVLGKNIYEVEPVNAKILERELDLLAKDLQLDGGVTKIEDLESIFTKQLIINKTQNSSNQPKIEKVAYSSEDPEEVIIDEFEINYGEAELGNSAIGNQAIANPAMNDREDGNAAMRKEKLYLIISTAPEKRLALKEIVAAFPNVSERTLRYDLKHLADEGRIVRQGSGGPSSYYTVKMGSNSSGLPASL